MLNVLKLKLLQRPVVINIDKIPVFSFALFHKYYISLGHIVGSLKDGWTEFEYSIYISVSGTVGDLSNTHSSLILCWKGQNGFVGSSFLHVIEKFP